jgi:hypothetical protein
MPTNAACGLMPASWMAIFAPTAPELGLTEIWSVPVVLLPVETPDVPLELGVPRGFVVVVSPPGVPSVEPGVVLLDDAVVAVEVGVVVVVVGLADVTAAVEAPVPPPE